MQATESNLRMVRGRCARSLLYFAHMVMPNIFTLRSPEFHRVIAREIEGDNDKINVIAPRGFGKSMLVIVAGALWHIFCARRRRRGRPQFVVIVSKSRGHAINLLTTIKNVLESEVFRLIFGYHGQMNAQVWREDMLILDTGDIIVCRGMRTPVRGLNINGVRPTYVALDDAEDEENTKTAERMADNFAWLINALVPMGDAQGCKFFNIGTPQKQSAIVFKLKEMSSWKTHHFKAIVRGENGEEESLWPEQRSMAWIRATRDELEALGRLSFFFKEYMCEIIGDEDQLFHPDHFRVRWKGELVTVNDYRYLDVEGEDELVPVNLFMGIDPASTITSTADYTAIAVIAVDHKGRRWLIDMLRKRIKPLAVAHEIEEMYRKYRPLKTQIETVGYQTMIGDYIRERGLFIPGLAIQNKPRDKKKDRLQGLQPIFAENRFLVPVKEQLPVAEEVVDEFLLFPNGSFDDTMDAIFYANKGAYKPYHDPIPRNRAEDRAPAYIKPRRRSNWMVA